MTTPAVVRQNLFFLQQGRELVESLADDLYATPAEDRPRAAGVGPHLRHCLDFYSSFLRDLGDGRIDYDRRERQSAVEIDRHSAITTIEQIESGMRKIRPEQVDQPLLVLHDPDPEEGRSSRWHPTTVGRELRFLVSHTVHHYALIAMILRQNDHEPGAEFGVAPATLLHWQTEAGVST